MTVNSQKFTDNECEDDTKLRKSRNILSVIKSDWISMSIQEVKWWESFLRFWKNEADNNNVAIIPFLCDLRKILPNAMECAKKESKASFRLLERIYSLLEYEKLYYKKPFTKTLNCEAFLMFVIKICGDFIPFYKENEETFVDEVLAKSLTEKRKGIDIDFSTLKWTPNLVSFVRYLEVVKDLEIVYNKRRQTLKLCGLCETDACSNVYIMGGGASLQSRIRDQIILLRCNMTVEEQRKIIPKENANTETKDNNERDFMKRKHSTIHDSPLVVDSCCIKAPCFHENSQLSNDHFINEEFTLPSIHVESYISIQGEIVDDDL